MRVRMCMSVRARARAYASAHECARLCACLRVRILNAIGTSFVPVHARHSACVSPPRPDPLFSHLMQRRLGLAEAFSTPMRSDGGPRAKMPLTRALAIAAVITCLLVFGSLRFASVSPLMAGHQGPQAPYGGYNDMALYAADRSLAHQLKRLRAEADAEVAVPLLPSHWRSLSFTHHYWVQVGLGKRGESKWPVAVQLGLFKALPQATVEIVRSTPERSGAPYQPLLWWVEAKALSPEAGLNGTLLAAQPDKRLLLAADVFFVQGCIRLMTTPECDWALDYSTMSVALHGAWKRSACSAGADGTLSCPPEARSLVSDGPLPLSRLRMRTVGEWNLIADLCSEHLVGEDVVDVEFHGWGVSKRWLLERVDSARRPEEELAMAVHFKNNTKLLPLWLQYWRALGVGRFYLYVNGQIEDLASEDASIASQLILDPGVTLIPWDLPFMQARGVTVLSGVCSGHFSQMLAFNHAYERVRKRHLYIGFYDPDEFALLDAASLHAAWATGENPMLQLIGRYGFPLALSLQNRFGAVMEPANGQALPLTAALERYWYGRAELEMARGKSWVRTVNPREDINIGNHDVFYFVSYSVHPKTGTVVQSGSGYETLRLRLATHAVAEDASMLHVLNFKPHHSKLPFNETEAEVEMVANKRLLPVAMLTLARARELCLNCIPGEPGCGYAC